MGKNRKNRPMKEKLDKVQIEFLYYRQYQQLTSCSAQ